MISAIQYDVVISEDGEGVDGSKVERIFEVLYFGVEPAWSMAVGWGFGACLLLEILSCTFDL